LGRSVDGGPVTLHHILSAFRGHLLAIRLRPGGVSTGWTGFLSATFLKGVRPSAEVRYHTDFIKV
jgi:hypothetical protein